MDNYESGAEFYHVRRYLAPLKSPLVLDVGGNVGSYAREVLGVNANAKIYAFEPNPVCYEQLKEVPNIHAYNIALGSKDEELTLFIPKDSKTSSLSSMHKEAVAAFYYDDIAEVSVPVKRLDDFVAQHLASHTIDLLKIDTEGHELEILKGAKELLASRRVRRIQFEFNTMNLISHATLKDFYDLLHDYELYRVLFSGELLPLKHYRAYNELYGYQDLVCVLREDKPTSLMNFDSKQD